MGHSTISMTLDRYGHLMPGNESEAASMLGSYVNREASQRRPDPAPGIVERNA
jgi:hypothetical protein